MLYLAYGSNLLPQRLQQRVPSARPVDTMCLRGWALRFHKRGQDGSAKCNLVSTGRSADKAHVVIFRLKSAHRWRLHRAEGLGHGYELASLRIRSLGKAFFYRASLSHIDDDLLPFTWYRDLVSAGAEYHGFPRAYIRQIDAVQTLADSHRGRNAGHRAVLYRSRSVRIWRR